MPVQEQIQALAASTKRLDGSQPAENCGPPGSGIIAFRNRLADVTPRALDLPGAEAMSFGEASRFRPHVQPGSRFSASESRAQAGALRNAVASQCLATRV
jgi:hypothetical protein